MEITNKPNGLAEATVTVNGVSINIPAPPAREVTLPYSKTTVQIRRGKGKDWIEAQMAAAQDQKALIPTLVRLLVTVNGQPLIPEFFMELDMEDAFVLQNEVMPKGFLGQTPEKSAT
jgi:hypothetical protein